jgi:hypothetical protein
MSNGIVFIDDNFVAPVDATMSIFDVGFVWGDTAYDVPNGDAVARVLLPGRSSEAG